MLQPRNHMQKAGMDLDHSLQSIDIELNFNIPVQPHQTSTTRTFFWYTIYLLEWFRQKLHEAGMDLDHSVQSYFDDFTITPICTSHSLAYD